MVAKTPTPTPAVTEVTFTPDGVILPAAKTIAPKTTRKSTAKVETVSFADLTVTLAAAELKSKAASADAGAARSERSTVAVDTIKTAFAEKIAVDDARTALLDAGIIKGTVSKIATILQALNDGHIFAVDIKSLNGAYNAVKEAEKIRATGGAPITAATPYSAPVAPVVATSPDEAMKILVDTIKAVSDPDEAYKLGGEWITRVTNEITKVLKSKDDGREGDDEDED